MSYPRDIFTRKSCSNGLVPKSPSMGRIHSTGRLPCTRAAQVASLAPHVVPHVLPRIIPECRQRSTTDSDPKILNNCFKEPRCGQSAPSPEAQTGVHEVHRGWCRMPDANIVRSCGKPESNGATATGARPTQHRCLFPRGACSEAGFLIWAVGARGPIPPSGNWRKRDAATSAKGHERPECSCSE